MTDDNKLQTERINLFNKDLSQFLNTSKKPKNENIEETINENISNLDNIDNLKQKIKNLEIKVKNLEEYKKLCEEHILQLFPGHTLPINEDDIKNFKEDSINFSNQQFSSLYIQLFNEKEQMSETLKKETLQNEELKNYIEILKQTLESSLIKNNIALNLENASKKTNLKPIDVLVGYTNMKEENEKNKKLLNHNKVIIEDLNSQIKNLKKLNEDFKIKNNQLIDEYKKIKKLYDDLIDKEKNLGKDNERIEIKYKNLLKENNEKDKLIDAYLNKLNQIERDLQDTNNIRGKLSKFKSDYENLEKLKNKLDNEVESLNYKNENLEKLNNKFEIENDKLKNDISIYKSQVDKLTESLSNNLLAYQSDKKILEESLKEIKKNLKKNENTIIDLINEIEDKKNEIENLKDLNKQKDKNIENLTSELNILKINFDSLKMESSRKMIITEQNIKNLINEKDKLNNIISNLEKEKINLIEKIKEKSEEIRLLKEANENYKNEISNEKNYNEDLKNNLSKIIQEKDLNSIEKSKLKNDNLTLNNEIQFWKEKYDEDLKEKMEENNKLKFTNEEMSYKLNDITRKYMKLYKDSYSKDEEIQKVFEREKNFKKNFEDLKNINGELNNKLEKNIFELKSEIQNNYDINSKNNKLTIKINDLSNQVKNLIYENAELKTEISLSRNKLLLQNSIEKDKEIELYTLKKNKEIMKKILDNCILIIQDYLNRNRDIIENNYDLFINEFNEFLLMKNIYLNDNGEQINYIEKLKKINSFLNIIVTQCEILYEHFYNLTTLNKDNNEKISSLENNLLNYEKDFNRLKIKEENKKIQNEIENKNNLIKNLEEQIKELQNDLNNEKENTKNLIEKLNGDEFYKRKNERLNYNNRNNFNKNLQIYGNTIDKDINDLTYEILNKKINKSNLYNDQTEIQGMSTCS